MKLVIASLLTASSAFASECPSPNAQALLKDARQLLVATSPGWNSHNASLRVFERASLHDQWHAKGPAQPAVIGRSGLAWSFLNRRLKKHDEPVKHEGDGRTPAGVHRLGTAFGFEPRDERPYLLIKPSTVCVDDAKSRHYNSIVNSDEVANDWTSAEKMREVAGYKIGFNIEYKSSAEKLAGSCIFVHIWSGPDHGTAGCLAASEEVIVDLQKQIKPEARAAIAFLPEEELADWQGCWKGAAP